ncbi:hypothetical protein JL722_6807 [Aureococcus anophagefferens]|nr:hypothetical protein JL722_6807 [Aureococcus anophagefferens]
MGASRRLLPPLLAFALARATTHDLFVDGAPPPIVATLPLLIDGAREAVELAVREGDDVAALLGAVTPRLSADNVDQVTSALYLRAAKGGHTVARRCAAAASRPGAGVVVATDGFALGEASRAALGAALRARARAAVATAEWVGPSAILAAAVAAAPDRAIVAAPPWGAAVRGDVFVDYERLARGRRGASSPGRRAAGCLSRTPLLVADAESWEALGAPDGGYALEGGVAAWLDDLGARRRRRGAGVVDALACDPLPDGGERLDAVGLPDDWERLRQVDADLFHLRSRPAGGGTSAPVPRPARTWLGRNLSGLSSTATSATGAANAATPSPRRSASTTTTASSRPCSRTSSRAHAVVVHHALEPWFGAPRPAARRRAAAAVAALAAASAKMSADDGSEVGFAAARGWPNPNASALYNFEQANVVALAEARGLRAAHVPLGAAPGLGDGAGALAGPRPVDVLFVGKLNGRRRNILRALRYDHGLRVLHGNADGPLFGEPLKAALEGAKVVLSLRFFDDDREWKMTRFLPPSPPAPSSSRSPPRGVQVAPMAAKLRRPLAKLARGACPGWVPETVEGDPAPWQWDVVMD